MIRPSHKADKGLEVHSISPGFFWFYCVGCYEIHDFECVLYGMCVYLQGLADSSVTFAEDISTLKTAVICWLC